MATAKGRMMNNHGQWIKPADDGKGPPDGGYARCNYCGSMTPDDFLAACRNPDAKVGGADWKYGWPHKFYVDLPNPNPTEMREQGGLYEGGKFTPSYGTYPTIHLKFYADHLKDWAPLADPRVADDIEKATGIRFAQDGPNLKYRAPCHGYQR